jgi:hypothetical protein
MYGGNRGFNSCISTPPKDLHGGHILMADPTVFTRSCGGTASFKHISPNIAMM